MCLQAVSGDGSRAAVGCQGAELSIWDIATQQRSYSAKGAKPNRVGLMDLPDNTAVTFIPGSEGAEVCIVPCCDRHASGTGLSSEVWQSMQICWT